MIYTASYCTLLSYGQVLYSWKKEIYCSFGFWKNEIHTFVVFIMWVFVNFSRVWGIFLNNCQRVSMTWHVQVFFHKKTNCKSRRWFNIAADSSFVKYRRLSNLTGSVGDSLLLTRRPLGASGHLVEEMTWCWWAMKIRESANGDGSLQNFIKP